MVILFDTKEVTVKRKGKKRCNTDRKQIASKVTDVNLNHSN